VETDEANRIKKAAGKKEYRSNPQVGHPKLVLDWSGGEDECSGVRLESSPMTDLVPKETVTSYRGHGEKSQKRFHERKR